MKIRNQWLLKAAWKAAGQLRQAEGVADDAGADGPILPFKNGARAAATISADFELCWAWRSLPKAHREERGRMERNNVPRILAILNKDRVPITWATVGHMFLDHCERGASGLAHPEMPRPPKNLSWKGDWYRHDPCSNVKEAPHWYCPDLIQLIRSNPVPHEIGSHSFSHIDFSAETSTPELVEAEMAACVEAMRPFGLKARSLVFCFNHMGYQHLDRLYKWGITAVRHRDENVRLTYPERTASGVYKLCESMNLRLASKYDYIDKAKVFIDEAISRRAAYHLWLHPSDDPRVFEEAFAPITQYLAAQRDQNRVWICTMADLAAYCEGRRTSQVELACDSGALAVKLSTTYNALQYGETDLTLAIPCPRRPAAILIRSADGGSEVVASDCRFRENDGALMINVPCRNSSIELQLAA